MTIILANYGYADGSGEYYITIDTDKCDGCGDCVEACPANIFKIVPDDYDEPKAVVRRQFAATLSDACPGYHRKCAEIEPNCHTACSPAAIEHSW